MKPLKFKAWAVVEKNGEVHWSMDLTTGAGYPLVSVRKPARGDMLAYNCERCVPVNVTITAAKRAKRGRK